MKWREGKKKKKKKGGGDGAQHFRFVVDSKKKKGPAAPAFRWNGREERKENNKGRGKEEDRPSIDLLVAGGSKNRGGVTTNLTSALP